MQSIRKVLLVAQREKVMLVDLKLAEKLYAMYDAYNPVRPPVPTFGELERFLGWNAANEIIEAGFYGRNFASRMASWCAVLAYNELGLFAVLECVHFDHTGEDMAHLGSADVFFIRTAADYRTAEAHLVPNGGSYDEHMALIIAPLSIMG
jgi:hypothetical protein